MVDLVKTGTEVDLNNSSHLLHSKALSKVRATHIRALFFPNQNLSVFVAKCWWGSVVWGGGLLSIFRLFKSILFFVNWISCSFFSYLTKYYNIMFIIIMRNELYYFDSVGIGRWDFLISCPLWFFPYSRLASYLRLILYLISFLFPCANVWENTLTWDPNFL